MVFTYLIVLVLCTAAVVGLIVWRLVHVGRGPRPTTGRLLNEWVWTLLPLLALVGLLWQALKVAK